MTKAAVGSLPSAAFFCMVASDENGDAINRRVAAIVAWQLSKSGRHPVDNFLDEKRDA